MGRELNVAAETANADDEESELLQSQLQNSGMGRRHIGRRLRRRLHTVYQHAHAALRVVDERRADQRAERGAEQADEVFGREVREKGVNRLCAQLNDCVRDSNTQLQSPQSAC